MTKVMYACIHGSCSSPTSVPLPTRQPQYRRKLWGFEAAIDLWRKKSLPSPRALGIDRLAPGKLVCVSKERRSHGWACFLVWCGSWIKVRVMPTFTGSWLIPRLNRFYVQRAGVMVELDSLAELVDRKSAGSSCR
jgi:hypothetical protein